MMKKYLLALVAVVAMNASVHADSVRADVVNVNKVDEKVQAKIAMFAALSPEDQDKVLQSIKEENPVICSCLFDGLTTDQKKIVKYALIAGAVITVAGVATWLIYRHYNQAPEVKKDDKPATTEVKPATTEVKPATTEVKPATTEVKPATTEVKPATTEVKPATTEVKPAATEVKK